MTLPALIDCKGIQNEMHAMVRTFAEESGVYINEWHGEKRADEVGRALRVALEGEVTVDRLEERLTRLHEMAESATAAIAQELAELRKDSARPPSATPSRA